MKLTLITLFTAVTLGALPVFSSSSSPSGPLAAAQGDRTFEVAMNGSSFFFEGPTNSAGAPANGTPFVIQGYIYPDGVFEVNGELSGVNADGSPQFPNQVLGTWICRGWHLQDGDAQSGAVVATTQIFDFGDAAGRQTIITDGIELADFNVPFSRAITGGTGALAQAASLGTICEQVYVGSGLNASGGFNTEFTFSRSR